MFSEMSGQHGGRSDIDRLVMRACADDYEEFSMIVSEIEKWTTGDPNAPTIRQIQEALIQSITNRDIDAFEVADCELRLTSILPDLETIGELWFYVTEQGRKWVQGVITCRGWRPNNRTVFGSWYPTLAAKTRTRRGWGTQGLWVDERKATAGPSTSLRAG